MKKFKDISFGDRLVGFRNPTYVIAEIGSNHGQSLQCALDMISMAAEAGADAVKFQSIRFDRLYDPDLEAPEFRERFKQIELDEAWYPELAERSREYGIHFLSAPTYVEAIGLLVDCGVPALKIASPQVQGNSLLVQRAAETGLPLILSMGYSDYGDISNVINTCIDAGNDKLVLLHCISKYPAAYAEAKLTFISTLSLMTDCPTGYSDHTLGTHMAAVAVSLGACMIEKHVTIDRSKSGPDHHFALTFQEFKLMVDQIREVKEALGDGSRVSLLPEELAQRKKVKLKAVTCQNLSQGDPIDENKIAFLRSETDGLSPAELGDLKRYKARHSIPKGTLLQWSNLQLI